jgi:hypothetical protein
MTQADSVHSTPPTNTSAIDAPKSTAKPHSRRSVLGAIAAATAAVTVAGARPTDAAPAIDPIYAAIERHKAAGVVWDAAVNVRFRFNDLHMDHERRKQLAVLEDAVHEAWEPCVQAGVDLINTGPTTLAGIVAAIGYLRIQMSDDGTYMPHHFVLDTGGDAQETMGWIDAFLDTVADATAALAKGSEANA